MLLGTEEKTAQPRTLRDGNRVEPSSPLGVLPCTVSKAGLAKHGGPGGQRWGLTAGLRRAGTGRRGWGKPQAGALEGPSLPPWPGAAGTCPEGTLRELE